MTSKEMRDNPLFMRNSYLSVGKWEIPLVKKQELCNDNIKLIACSDTKANDNEENKKKGVHFFVDDYRFEGIYNNPERTLNRYLQYSFLLTPDFSLYTDLPLWIQLQNVAKNRWTGVFWQEHGQIVYPTISWGDARSYAFCFDGVEEKSTVAIGMIGCKQSRVDFMRGYNELLERINPENIVVFGKPFPDMKGNIICIDYLESRRVVR